MSNLEQELRNYKFRGNLIIICFILFIFEIIESESCSLSEKTESLSTGFPKSGRIQEKIMAIRACSEQKSGIEEMDDCNEYYIEAKVQPPKKQVNNRKQKQEFDFISNRINIRRKRGSINVRRGRRMRTSRAKPKFRNEGRRTKTGQKQKTHSKHPQQN